MTKKYSGPNWKFNYYVNRRRFDKKVSLFTLGLYSRMDMLYPADKHLPPYTQIAKDSDVCKQTVQTHMTELVKSGHILQKGRKRFLNPYLSWKGTIWQKEEFIKKHNIRQLARPFFTTVENIQIDMEHEQSLKNESQNEPI